MVNKERQKSKDLYNSLPHRESYLPRFETNTLKYEARVHHSVLRNYYKKTIDHIVSILSFMSFTNPSPMTEAQDLGLGYNLRNFLVVADTIAHRDGGLYVDISQPNSITHVTLDMVQSNTKGVVKYRNVHNDTVSVKEDELVAYYYNYGLPEPGEYYFRPLFPTLLETNLAWFRLYSNYTSTLDYYAKPLLVRTRSQIIANNNEQVINFETGNKLLEIAAGEELYFLSLATDNVAAQQTELIRLESYMTEVLDRVLSIGTTGNKTATEIEMIQNESMLDFTIAAQTKRANVMRLLYLFYIKHYPEYANSVDVTIHNPYETTEDNRYYKDVA